MIFSGELCSKVLNGEKTQTRRMKKDSERLLAGHHDLPDKVMQKVGGHRYEIIKWQVGHTYAVQPRRGEKAVGRIKLLAIREERLCDITWQDVQAEGIDLAGMTSRGRNRNIDAGHRFGELWNSINKTAGTRWSDNPAVWVLTFQYC